jgi:hypothetical protein
MEGQLSFASLDFAGKKKRTKRDVFLAEMVTAVPWAALEGVIEPHYPKTGSAGHRREPLCSPLDPNFEFSPKGEVKSSLPGRGDGEIVPGSAMPEMAKRASHIDPPKHQAPLCGEHSPNAERTVGSARIVTKSLTRDAELENDQGVGSRVRYARCWLAASVAV